MSLLAILLLAGCTSAREWWHNGLKVGPNYARPAAPVAAEWVDHDKPDIRSEPARYNAWWTVFGDPALSELVDVGYRENLPLKVAAWRVVEARAQRGIATGNLFAQLQEMTVRYTRNTSSGTTRFGGIGNFPKSYFQRWEVGFDAAWELDFWGRFRREVEAADADLSAEIANYDDVLVILQGEVAATYVEIRTLQERLREAQRSVAIQEDTLEIAQARVEVGGGQVVDVEQAKADLAVTKSAIPLLETSYRQAQNKLCVLLGMPPRDLRPILAQGGSIPQVPAETEILVGIPAELLRRRPDIRSAELRTRRGLGAGQRADLRYAQALRLLAHASRLYGPGSGKAGWRHRRSGSRTDRVSAGDRRRWADRSGCRRHRVGLAHVPARSVAQREHFHGTTR